MPSDIVSAHWQDCLAHRDGTGRPRGFDPFAHGGMGAELLWRMEWLSYWRVRRAFPALQTIWQVAARITRTLGATPDYYTFRTAAALAVVERAWAMSGVPDSVLLIGDGSGLLGATLQLRCPTMRIGCMDIPEILPYQRVPYGSRVSAIAWHTPDQLASLPPYAWAISMACFQELTPSMIAAYFERLRAWRAWFYCVSRLEKRLPDGTLVCFHAYPWRDADQRWLDGPCPYYTHRFASPWPYYRRKQSLMWHRLARLQ